MLEMVSNRVCLFSGGELMVMQYLIQRNDDYIDRMVDDKVHCMQKAKAYELDYWDGDRRFGYGGYKYLEGRWKPVAEALIDKYSLTNNSNLLDVGCGKAYLLYELKLLLPDLRVKGFDISKHGLKELRLHGL